MSGAQLDYGANLFRKKFIKFSPLMNVSLSLKSLLGAFRTLEIDVYVEHGPINLIVHS